MANSNGPALSGRLDDYSVLTRVSVAGKKARRRTGDWSIYAAAAGSALAMSTSASASIITGNFNVSVEAPVVSTNRVPPPYQQLGLQFGNCASAVAPGSPCLNPVGFFHTAGGEPAFDEINIRANTKSAKLSVQGVNPIQIFVDTTYPNSVRNFAAGAHISGAAGPTGHTGVAASVTAGYGLFLLDEPGFAGFQIDLGNGHFDYGWLQLLYTQDVENFSRPILTAGAWGIEDEADKPIAAGDTGPVIASTPEPGTMALGLLALGAAGIEALRRRRQQQKA